MKTVLYVSAQTGEVLQKTEGKERAWNYIGAVVHWIYPTILRSNWSLWDQVVWWLSLAGLVTTLIGLLLGVMRSRGARNEDPTGYFQSLQSLVARAPCSRCIRRGNCFNLDI